MEHTALVPFTSKPMSGNEIWTARFAAVISDESLSDDGRMRGVLDVAREMTRRPICLEQVTEDADVGMYVNATSRGIVSYWGLVDRGCYGYRPYVIVCSDTYFKDASPERIVELFELRYRIYIQEMHRSGMDPEAYLHFEEVDMPLFRRLDELGILCEAPFWGDLDGWVNHANYYRDSLHRREAYHPAPTVPDSFMVLMLGMPLLLTMIVALVITACSGILSNL